MHSLRHVLAPLLIAALITAPVLPPLSARPATSRSILAGFTKGPWSLPTRGFRLSLPQQWLAQMGGGYQRVLTCALADKTGNPRQIILVEMGVSRSPNLRAHADLLAQESKGKLVETRHQLDKKSAFVLDLPGKEPGMTKAWAQQKVVLAAQGKQTFTIRFFGDAGENLDTTMATLSRGWHWQPFAPPALHLQLASTPVTFSRGRVEMRVPEMMWAVPPQSAGTQDEMMSVYDARIDVSALTLVVNTIPVPQTMTVAAIRRNFAAVLKQRLHLAHELVWQDFPGQPSRTLCSFFSVPTSLSESGYPAVSAYGLVKMSDKEWGLLTFTVTGQDGTSKALYAAATRRMFSSVTLSSKHK